VDIGQARMAELWKHYNKLCCRTTEDGRTQKRKQGFHFRSVFLNNVIENILYNFEKNNNRKQKISNNGTALCPECEGEAFKFPCILQQ
jgi:hypothetical protein